MFGCASAIGTKKVGTAKVYRQVNTNALLEDQYSALSQNVLYRHDLKEQFKKDPQKVLKYLHQKTIEDNRRDLLFALAELSYYTAEYILKGRSDVNEQSAQKYYLGAAIYAYFYLFDKSRTDRLDPYNRYFRWACDFYNIALAKALTKQEGRLEIEDGVYELPIGKITLTVQRQRFPWELNQFEKIIAADQLLVYGLSVRNRDAGMGVPFIAVEKRSERIPVKRSLPGTVFLRIEGGVRGTEATIFKGRLELYSAFDDIKVQVGSKRIPLERDLSAQLAYTLEQPLLWDIGIAEFLTGKERIQSGVYPGNPYSPGKVPIVFVHGTVSNPFKWAEMMNTLRSDPVIRRHFHFWFYIYDSGKPIIYSALHLRETLTRILSDLDPEGKDLALQRMVVIGHSQGGLLTKITAVDTGERLLKRLTGKGLNELEISVEEQETIRNYMIFEPLPFVRRVVFVATPHRGSFLAKEWIRGLVRKLVSFPQKIVERGFKLAQAVATLKLPEEFSSIETLTSIDSMSPRNPALLGLAEIPLGSRVKGHSIIAVKDDNDPSQGNDGVVEYQSAHVDYVESEFIVRSGHSCQGHPLVIEEVRRILLKHLKTDAR
ncbi:MAG: alpha/beta hydrolase [Deltaproteobacteria bacterium]|nr:alpha/beta hydrolase [Deltaproteobacteria bacterium]